MNIEIKDIKDLFKKRDKDANKYDFGVVGLMGGSPSFSGAIKLASMSHGALRSGAGLSRVIVDEDIQDYVAPYLVEQTLWVLHDDLDKAILNLDVLAIGMGFGNSEKHITYLEYVLKNYSNKLIIDADGLNILSKNLHWLNNTSAKIVLTPHLKEFSRLLNKPVSAIEDKREEYAIKFAREHNVILLLKGSNTIVTDGTTTYHVTSGDAGMATAGSGDVLSGIIAGFLGNHEYNTLSVAAAAYLAGLAGTLASQKYTDIAMIASDTIKFIPDAIKIIRGN